jgi:hypothetical protein
MGLRPYHSYRWVKLRNVSGDVVEGEIEVVLVENYLTVL